MAAGKYGREFKSFVVNVSPQEHQEYKLRAVRYRVSISDVIRMCLADESIWEKAAKLKRESKSKEE